MHRYAHPRSDVRRCAVGCSAPDGGTATQDAGGKGDNPGGSGGNGTSGGNADMAVLGGGGGGGEGGGGGGGGGGVVAEAVAVAAARSSSSPCSATAAAEPGRHQRLSLRDYLPDLHARAVARRAVRRRHRRLHVRLDGDGGDGAGGAVPTGDGGLHGRPHLPRDGNREYRLPDSNCPNLNQTPNIQVFMKLVPSGVTKPYYRIDVDTPLGKAKLVFIAANAGTRRSRRG